MSGGLLASFLFASVLLARAGRSNAQAAPPAPAAAPSAVHIDEYEFDLDHKEITINGKLPNPCFATPVASLVPDPADASTLILRVSAAPSTQICFAQLEGVEETLHLPTLAKTSGLAIVPGAQYVIRSESADMAFGIDADDLL